MIAVCSKLESITLWNFLGIISHIKWTSPVIKLSDYIIIFVFSLRCKLWWVYKQMISIVINVSEKTSKTLVEDSREKLEYLLIKKPLNYLKNY